MNFGSKRRLKPRRMPVDAGIVDVTFTPIRDTEVQIAPLSENSASVKKVRALEAYHSHPSQIEEHAQLP